MFTRNTEKLQRVIVYANHPLRCCRCRVSKVGLGNSGTCEATSIDPREVCPLRSSISYQRSDLCSTFRNVYAVDEIHRGYGIPPLRQPTEANQHAELFYSGAARLRPSASTLPRLSAAAVSARYQSNVPTQQPDPKTKAQAIIDALPGNGLVAKTAILSSAAGLSIAAISNEIYVFNEETVVAFCLLSVFTAIGKYGGPMYAEWATGQVNKIRDILNAARADHTQAVQDRIESVQQMGNVVDVTKALFEVSRVRLITA
jgi:hypothetical protein